MKAPWPRGSQFFLLAYSFLYMHYYNHTTSITPLYTYHDCYLFDDDLPVSFGVFIELLIADVLQCLEVLRLGGYTLSSDLSGFADCTPPERWKGSRLATKGKDTLELVKVGSQLLDLFFSLLNLSFLLLQDRLKVPYLFITLAQGSLQLLYRAHPCCGRWLCMW